MHPPKSVRRAALGVAVAGVAFGAVPALASASPCAYNPTQKVASVVDSSGVSQLRVGVNGNVIFTRDGGNPPINCVGGGTVATTTNTDRIAVFAQAKSASDGVVLDQARGAFAPGATPEADGNSELELALNGQSGNLSVFGTPGDDVIRVAGADRLTGPGALDFGSDDDDDVTFAASTVSLVGGDGADVLSGLGYFGRFATRTPLGFSGGAGDDVIFGGLGVDHFSGGAGADTLHTDDTNPELVNGGPDFDDAFRDVADIIADVEFSELIRVGTLRLAPRTVNADARKWAKTTMRWTHPTSWRELRKVEVKLYRGAKLVGTIDVRPRGTRLAARGAVDIMANRSLVSHSAKTVTARLAMRFPRSLAGASLRVDVQATDRDGHKQLSPDAGLIRVAK